MKELILGIVLSVSIVFTSQAQLRIAIVGGGHQSEILEENDLAGFDEYRKGFSGRTGAHFGFLAEIPFSATSKFFIQPGVIFQTRGRKHFNTHDSTVVFERPALPDSVVNTIYIENRRHFINYIDIPINIVYKLSLGKKIKFIIGGGPYLSFFYSGFDKREKNVVGVSYKNEDDLDLPVGNEPGQYNILNYGVNGLAGFELGRVFLTANYSRGLNGFYKPKDYNGTFKHELIGGTLGIFIGKTVELEKKIKDKDKDGISDEKDNCPELAGPAVTNGCPDKDADGIADKDDKCPDVGGTLANRGCPILDKDNDGINDDKDKCPAVPGVARFQGCPVPDTDSDGVNDEEDKCPSQPGLGRYQGCPIPDTDGDGINNEEDKCPDVKGTKEKNGCPEEIKKEVIERINYAAKRIQFKSGNSELQPESFTVLNEVAAILKASPDLKLAIEGHTSADGSYEGNMKLSQARADKVKAYLVSRGISELRLNARGLGSDQPLNEGKTAAQRTQNRRVELKLSN